MTRARDLSRLANSNVLTVLDNGNVGVGSTIPDVKLDVVGVVSATSFYGDGTNLSNTGSTLSAASGTERVVLTNLTSGTMTASSTDANLTYNATTDTLNVSNVSIVGTATTALIVEGDARVTGILTVGTSSVTLDGTNNQVNVGTGVTIDGNTGNLALSGIITAASFVGNGSGLTGAGSTVADDTSTNSTFYPLFTTITSGTVTATKVSTTKLTFNPSTGTLSATDLNSSSDASLKENITTVEGALDKVNDLHGVKFSWKEDGRASYGVIAQELEQVLPELVSDTDPKTVNYNGIIGVLIEAVKELTARVEELENKS